MPECSKIHEMFGFIFRSGLPCPDFFWRCAGAVSIAVAVAVALPARATSPGAPPAAAGSTATPATRPLPRIALQLGGRRVIAEIAADDATRARGLMFREHLAPDHGMLFIYPEAMPMCFWMKNTSLPLSIAFIDSRGDIINLADMRPQSLESHCSLAPALYALEIEQGWFARHGVRSGDHVGGLPRVAGVHR